MVEKMYIKTEINTEGDTFGDEDRSDAFHYSLHIKNETLAIKHEIAELEDASFEVDNIFITQPKVDLDIRIEEIGNGLSGTERKCDICGKCFFNGLELITHRYAHTEDTYYTCCICSCNSFHLKPDLHRHMLNVHFNRTSKSPIFAKHNALKRSNNTDKLYQSDKCHFDSSHTDEKPYKCDVCNKRVAFNSQLIAHNRIHTGEKPYECDVCNKRFRCTFYLTTHKRCHMDEKPYKCGICNKRFTSNSNLVAHNRIHTGVKPYECDICRKRFRQTSGLTTHRHTHMNEKPYKCDICNKRFISNSNLVAHNRIHSGEKLLKCDICNKQCRTKSNLNSHKRIHASKKHFK